MCFYSKQSRKAAELENRFNAKVEEPDIFRENSVYNGFTYPKTPVIANENTKAIKHFQWGLIPPWAKDKTIQSYTLNAKIETIHEKPSFRGSVKNRCLVIADGFFEWQWLDPNGKKKQKYLITLPGEDLFAFGGIWSEWADKSTGEIVKTYSIVTTAANKLMAEIHNSKRRMPVILNPSEEEEWLGCANMKEFAIREIGLKAVPV